MSEDGAFSYVAELFVLRFRNIGDILGSKAVLDQFAVVFLVANDDRTSIDLDDLASHTEVIDRYVVAISKF